MVRRAFYAVSDLKHKIERYLKAKGVDEYSMLKDVYKQVLSLEELSKITLNTDFDEAITIKADRLLDMVDDLKFEVKQDIVHIKKIKEEIDSFMISDELKMMEQECSDGLYNVSFIDNDKAAAAVSSSEVVIGVCEVYQQLKDQLLCFRPQVTSLVGMAGIGKTALANKLFNDPTIMKSFDHRVWIRLGKRYRAKDILRCILEEIGRIPQGDEKKQLKGILKSERYLIVLDDVWDRFTGLLLYPTTHRAPPILSGESESRILITSRLHQLDDNRDEIYPINIKMRLLNREESWDLLRHKVFASSSCPPQLEKAGIKIADKCEGLPLTILVVARLLSHHEEEDLAGIVPSLLIGISKSRLAASILPSGMSKKLAHETKFALILSSRNDGLGDGIDGHKRVSFINNVLFGIKDVHKSVEDNCASAARSLFCFGPYHQYQVPLSFRLEFLKELDALSIRFYEFSMEVLQLVQLGYLSLTVDGVIPASISRLQRLEFLIVDQHHNIKSCKDASYLPMEIWSLQKLNHLQVMGCDLPDPCGASMSNLSTLSDVSVHSCTIAVFTGIPNLTNLKILIEFAPGDDSKPFIYFGVDHISYLSRLHSLKCVIANPEVVPPFAPFSSFLARSCLRNLSLSGLGYPWKEMRIIASLPRLEVLKLKNYAFQGPEWEVEETKFSVLTSLLIDDTDFVDWKIGSHAFDGIWSLRIKQCYKLQKIHGNFGPFLKRIELVDCNPSCVKEFKKIISDDTILDVHSSWEDRKLKTLITSLKRCAGIHVEG